MRTEYTECLSNRRLLVCLHFLSFALLYLPIGFGWYWGNLVVYLNSYWFAKHPNSNFQTPWLLSVFIIFWSTSLILAGYLIKRIDRCLISLIGVILFNSGIALSHFFVVYSVEAVHVTLGVVTAMGLGFIQTEVLTRIAKLTTGRSGMAMAILWNFNNGGAILMTAVITWYANPLNREADVHFGRIKLFSDKTVIERVPFLFVVLGAITSALQFSGFALSVFLNKKGVTMNSKTPDESCDPNVTTSRRDGQLGESTSMAWDGADSVDKMVCTQTRASNSNTVVVRLSNSGTDKERCQDSKKTQSEDGKMSSRTRLIQSHKNYGDLDSTTTTTTTHGSPKPVVPSTDADDEGPGPRQLLRTATFYVLWYTTFSLDTSLVVMLNFYKIFGELWIRDDHFLTNLGIASLCTMVVMRSFVAHFLDNTSVKTFQIFLTSSMALTLLFYDLTPRVSPWLFAVWTCVIMTLCSSVYLNSSVTTLRLFGKSHFGLNYGLTSTSAIVLNVVAPSVFNTVLQHLGWHGLFMGTAVLNTLALIANVITLPNKT